MEYIALFFTHSGALQYERFLKAKSIKAVLMPVPRKLSSSCGIGVRFTSEEEISTIISEDIDKIFMIQEKNYGLIYSSE